jgi:hypothetical protein
MGKVSDFTALLSPVNHLSVEDRHHDLCLLDLDRIDLEDL